MTIIDPQVTQTVRQILDGGAVLEALRVGSRRAVRMHKLLGHPVATSENGKVVWIPAEEIKIDEPDGAGDHAVQK